MGEVHKSGMSGETNIFFIFTSAHTSAALRRGAAP